MQNAILKTQSLPSTAIFRKLQPKRKLSHSQRCRLVTVLARQYMRHEKTLTLSDAMLYAWDEVKQNEARFTLIKFTKTVKKTNKIVTCQRVVMSDDWSNYYQVKGTGRPLKEGQVLFADAARIEAGLKSILISTYTERIIERI